MGPESEPESESDRWLSTAEKLLAASDLVGSRRFAERALDSDPLTPSDRADRLIAVADVLLASRASARPDPYSILSSPPRSAPSAVLSSYRRLSLLLNPSSNHLPFAAHASDLVSYAYSVLSDPGRRSDPDAASTASAAAAAGFWTSCPSCCHVYLYDRAHVGAELRCQQCGKGFRADELAAAPPVVEGTDMYYCTWGYFPLGPNGPQQPPPPPAAEEAAPPAAAAGRAAGEKRNAGAGGIDINREIDDDDDDDDDDVIELKVD